MFEEDQFIQISALQHYAFCARQCALIHLEQTWVENRFTAEGRVIHEIAHSQESRNKKGIRYERGLPLSSYRLGLTGKADVIEFHKSMETNICIPYPVEYKRGRPKPAGEDYDKYQLCAQALCLEEMLNMKIGYGALYYGESKRRFEVSFDSSLRKKTQDLISEVHEFLDVGKTPPPIQTGKCKRCSFIDTCMPSLFEHALSTKKYILKEIEKL